MAITIQSVPDEDGNDVMALNHLFLPTVHWWEDRPKGRAHVLCQVYPGPDGEFILQTTGSVIDHPLYSRRPWEKLVGFRVVPASELYYSAVDKRLRQEFMNKSALLRVFMPDDAMVMLADIADDHPSLPMHLNYAVGT